MDKVAALKRTALFGELDEGTLKALAERAVERRYERDEVLFIAGDEPSVVLFLDQRDVRRLSLAHPEIALAARKVLAARLRRCAELVETLSLREVGQRLARLQHDGLVKHEGRRLTIQDEHALAAFAGEE